MTDHLLRSSLDALAVGYEATQGTRPNRMTVGSAVAEALEPEHGPHPLHLHWISPTPGVWFPAPPTREEHWWAQVRRAIDCRRRFGGHWWHPADAMIAWFCCVCGTDRDGWPRDGH